MRSNQHGGRVAGTLHVQNKMLPVVQVLTGTFTIDADMPNYMFLDAGGANRTVLLPAEASGLWFIIINNGDDGELTVQEDSATTTIAGIPVGGSAQLYCDGTNWRELGAGEYAEGFGDRALVEEDFHGTWLDTDAGPADMWKTIGGGGTGNEKATTVANSLNGEVTLKSASDDVHHAFNTSMFTGINLAYKANQGGLFFEARVKLDAITAVCLFVGFTDTVAVVPMELPIFKADGTDDVDSDAADACGVVFDTDGTTDQFFHAGVKAGTDTAAQHGGASAVPVAATYALIRVEVSAAGAVRGFLNGVALGDWVADAVTITTGLTPCIAISNRGAAQRIATIDYVRVGQNR